MPCITNEAKLNDSATGSPHRVVEGALFQPKLEAKSPRKPLQLNLLSWKIVAEGQLARRR